MLALLAMPATPALAEGEKARDLPRSSSTLHSGIEQSQLRLAPNRDSRSKSAPVVVRSLTDHPGRARAVTEVQKAEIRKVLEELDGNTKFICTGARLAGQPAGMNQVVRLRAKLVCDYAKSLRPDLSYWYQTKVTQHSKFNGRVIVVSK
jgi:hypothetical protein